MRQHDAAGATRCFTARSEFTPPVSESRLSTPRHHKHPCSPRIRASVTPTTRQSRTPTLLPCSPRSRTSPGSAARRSVTLTTRTRLGRQSETRSLRLTRRCLPPFWSQRRSEECATRTTSTSSARSASSLRGLAFLASVPQQHSQNSNRAATTRLADGKVSEAKGVRLVHRRSHAGRCVCAVVTSEDP